MATIISVPTGRSTAGERRVGRLLERLPEDWIVYYEPRIRNGGGHLHPDFVVLAPAFGLLVLEVKDWTAGFIHSINGSRFTLRNQSGFWNHDPLDQVRGYWQAIKDACREDLFGQDLVNGEGRLCFPVGAAVVFPCLSSAEIGRSPHGAVWGAVFTKTNSVLVDQLREWEGQDAEALAESLRPFFSVPFQMRREFTARQIDALRWVLFPETRMDEVLAHGQEDGERVISVLDARQEQQARSLGEGHRILFGVAGSGKTVLLMARARWLAQSHPERRCLLLCYTKALAERLRHRLADCPSVDVRHFDGWSKERGVVRQCQEEGDVFGERLLAHLREQGEAARTLDAVLIDEAQDFEATWFQCVLAALKDPEHGDLVIVADGCQRLYKRGRVSWKAVGVRAKGRSSSARYDLDRNYRNTPAIAALAAHFGADESSDDGVSALRVAQHRCRRLGNTDPVLIQAADHESQCDAAVEIVERWLSGGYRGGKLRPEQIGILYPRLAPGERNVIERLIERVSRLAPIRWLSNRHTFRAHAAVNDAAIKVQTIHSSKGLEYRAVILLWTDLVSTGGGLDGEGRRLLYVGITRAETELVLVANRDSQIAGELKRHCRVVSHPLRAPAKAVA